VLRAEFLETVRALAVVRGQAPVGARDDPSAFDVVARVVRLCDERAARAEVAPDDDGL
jgi:hypothetical protein